MPRPKPEIESERVIIPLPKPLIEEIDDYRFAERIPSRSEAVRQLLREGLKAVAARKKRTKS
jgi:metal-responsive CopG/Arc/MetJ family transcriptional regulator